MAKITQKTLIHGFGILFLFFHFGDFRGILIILEVWGIFWLF
jgi:hypothetical protein